MRQVFIILVIFLFASRLIISQERDIITEFSSYQDMRKHFGELYQQGKFNEAAALLETHLTTFPDHLQANAYNLALTYGHLEQLQKGIDVLRSAQDQGVWFNKYGFVHAAWEPFKKIDGFDLMLEKNEHLRQEAQKSSIAMLEVSTPENYDSTKKYPLFIALHGGGGNIEEFIPIWTSAKLQKDFILAYLQSSQIISMNGFNWTEDMEITQREILDAFGKIRAEYPIDKNKIIIGGFSSGGVAAMDAVLCKLIPASGFVVLCPDKPESCTFENIENMVGRNIRGVILSMEMDPRLDVQQAFVEDFEKAGLQHRFIITPNMGHWIPDDLDKKLDEAIDFINGKE